MNIILSQLELYEFLKLRLGEQEAKSLVTLVKTEVEEKFEQKEHIFATKQDLKKTRQELIRWMVSLASVSSLMLGAITYHFDKRFEAVDRRFEEQIANFNKRFEEQTASFNKRFEEQSASFDKRFEEQIANFNQQMKIQTELILLKIDARLKNK